MWSAFAAFARRNALPLKAVATIRAWIEAVGQERQVAPATLLRYVSHVTVMNDRIFGPLGGPEALQLEDMRASLARKEAGRATTQAVAATPGDLRRLWKEAPGQVRLVASLLWAGAMRFSDLVAVRTRDVLIRDGSTAEVTLRVTKTSQRGGPPRVVVLKLPRRVMKRLRQQLESGEGPLIAMTCAQFRNAVKRVCPHLTAHSFRRGAVQAAMDSGVEDTAVMRLTGHKSLESLTTYAGRLPMLWRREMEAASAATVW